METIMEMGWVMGGICCCAVGVAATLYGGRAFTFARAITSGWNKDNVAGRLAICKECPRVKAREYVDPEGTMTTFLYCDECKCGSHHIAELNVKLGFNNIKCPLDKWGPKVGMTVHEGHDMLIERGRKEREEDQRERTNMMAGRDRDDNGPLISQPSARVPLGNKRPGTGQPSNITAAAQAQLKPTAAAVEAQRQRISKAKAEAEARARIKPDAPVDSTNAAAHHIVQTNKIWGDRGKEAESATATSTEETAKNTAPLAGTDHEGHILVDHKESSDGSGQTLD